MNFCRWRVGLPAGIVMAVMSTAAVLVAMAPQVVVPASEINALKREYAFIRFSQLTTSMTPPAPPRHDGVSRTAVPALRHGEDSTRSLSMSVRVMVATMGGVVVLVAQRAFGHLLFDPTWSDDIVTLGLPLLLAVVATSVAGITVWRGSRMPLADVPRS